MSRNRDLTRPEEEGPNGPAYRDGSLEVVEALRNFTRAPVAAPGWRARTYVIPAGVPVQIADVNRQRCRIQVWATAAAFIGPAQSDPANAALNFADTFPLVAGLPPVAMTHTGAIWASSVAGASVSVIEEYASRDA